MTSHLGEVVLWVEGLTVYRGSQLAVQNVSFALEAGSHTAIVGPNGAGKSTLVQAILGILPRQCGSIGILGEPLRLSGYLPQKVRQQIAYVPQRLQFNPAIPLTVAEFVALGWGSLRPRWPWQQQAARQEAVQKALQRAEALHLASKLLGQLSGGELKRVLLAYCLVWPRRLLVLDEAPAGLDSPSEGEFYRLLEELRRSLGWAILQVSHDLEMVSRHCDRVLCLNRSLICQGSPSVTLLPEVLSQVYGPEFARYIHHH
ncbi:ABC transporter ATP-binding protein [Synechococcus sp. 63AY4M2]|uniref:metal ABC transporter ATP-binding protein n=1 Tax=Synechococcus sp. 63AY4M2 TaxID=1353266 RepID=UPI000C433B03|nr:metal ABC transporter ATP-binding protein [Synechococcus sp. 63AY4M2]PIK86532.1 ABC transporter ATP-binding protein [Synechococcus sp. 63AY4M2]